MAKIIRPTNKVTVFDPESGKMQEAVTTDEDEMARRAKKAAAAENKKTKKAK
jgi:hypothetical protein